MPKKTFHNLDIDRQSVIVDAFFREFTVHKFDDASISTVLKDLGLAKGSFYQYFENKRDLFIYLISICHETQMKYNQHVVRENYDDFWDYWRAMYVEGIKYDREHPIKSNFGYQLFNNMNSPNMKEMLKTFIAQNQMHLEKMVQTEVDNGQFRKDIPVERIAFFLMHMGTQLLEYMQLHHTEELNKKVRTGESIFAGDNEELLFELLEDNIRLQSAAVDVKN